MNGKGHELTTLAALDALPAWQQQLWAPERGKLAKEYSLYGDTYAVNPDELGPYVELPDGTIPDFYMPKLRWKHHIAPAVDFWEAPFYDRTLSTCRHFGGRIAQALQDEDLTTAAKLAGTFAHYVEDNACPGHAMDDTDLEIVKDLLPPPEELRRFPFHPRMELAPPPFSLDGRAPQLLGRSIDELASAFVDRLVAMTLASRKTVLPFFQSFYDGDEERAAELNMANCRQAAALLADFLNTVTCIAADRLDGETAAPTYRSISAMYPYRQTAWAPGPYAQTAPGELIGVNLDDTYQPIPCELPGESGPVVVAESLGATAYYEYDFCIPSGIYSQFACEIGIHASLGANFPIIFTVYSGDDLLFQHEQRHSEPAITVQVDWPSQGERLRLVTHVPDDADVQRVNHLPVAPTGHAIWAHPRLLG